MNDLRSQEKCSEFHEETVYSLHTEDIQQKLNHPAGSSGLGRSMGLCVVSKELQTLSSFLRRPALWFSRLFAHLSQTSGIQATANTYNSFKDEFKPPTVSLFSLP